MALFIALCGITLSITAVVFAIREYLRHKEREQELIGRVELAERNLRHLGDLAGEVAHEIKNPLTAILCSTETLHLLLKDQLDETQRNAFAYIKDYGDLMLRLTSDFLEVSKIETGRIEVSPQPIKVSEVVNSIIGLLQAKAHAKQVSVSAKIDESKLQIVFDSKHFKQVLLNLLHNAIKFTSAGGEIRVIVARDFPSTKVRIAVEDTGVGVSEEHLPRIFDLYQSSQSELKDQSDFGTGLGLALCKMLVEANKSTIEVESVLGVGTTFSFSADLYQPKDEEEQKPKVRSRISEATRQPTPLVGQRFLFLEEDDRMADSLVHLVEAWGGVVDLVQSAVDAVDALEDGNYDAVVVDHTSPTNISDDLVKQLKDTADSSGATMIITADEFPEGLSEEAGGEVRMIQKPYSGDTLLRSLLQTGKFSISH